MIILGVVVAVLALGAAAAWAVSRLDVAGVADPVTTRSARPLPAGPLAAADVQDLRLDQTLRGYQMRQVDDALTRLADELAARDEEIARLRHELDDRPAPLGAGEVRHDQEPLAGTPLRERQDR